MTKGREQEICSCCSKRRTVKHYIIKGKAVQLCKECDFIKIKK